MLTACRGQNNNLKTEVAIFQSVFMKIVFGENFGEHAKNQC